MQMSENCFVNKFNMTFLILLSRHYLNAIYCCFFIIFYSSAVFRKTKQYCKYVTFGTF